MRTIHNLAFLTAALLGLAPAAFGQLNFQHKLFQSNINLDLGAQNTLVGNVGEAFATWQTGAQVNYLGFYDSNGDGLANSHNVSLWTSGGSLLASVTVPAGTAAPLVDGYRWVALSSPLTLPASTWYTLAASVDNIDMWGDGISGANVTVDDPYYNTGGWGGPYGRFGYDASNLVEPPNGSYGGVVFPAANLGFAVVPEPSSAAIACLGCVGLLLRRRASR